MPRVKVSRPTPSPTPPTASRPTIGRLALEQLIQACDNDLAWLEQEYRRAVGGVMDRRRVYVERLGEL